MIITSISGFFPLQPSGKMKIKPCQEHTLTLSTVTTCFTLTPFRVMEGKIVLKQWLIPWYVILSFSKERQTGKPIRHESDVCILWPPTFINRTFILLCGLFVGGDCRNWILCFKLVSLLVTIASQTKQRRGYHRTFCYICVEHYVLSITWLLAIIVRLQLIIWNARNDYNLYRL